MRTIVLVGRLLRSFHTGDDTVQSSHNVDDLSNKSSAADESEGVNFIYIDDLGI